MKIFSLLSVVMVLLLTACDRHEWESKDGQMGTKELYKHHGDDHGSDSHGGEETSH